MRDKRIVLSAVEYLNTKPFLEGLNGDGCHKLIEVTLDSPAECSRKLQTGQAQIGLVPVADLESLVGYRPITSWCIAADGMVESVILASEQPIEQLNQILLDRQSKTSNQLMQILADEYYKIDCSFNVGDINYLDHVSGSTGAVVIGDRALKLSHRFKYRYDLAQAWKEMTGLPFVFAVWVASDGVSDEIEFMLDAAFEKGMAKRQEIAKNYQPAFNGVNIYHYLTQQIRYKIAPTYREGQELFLSKIRQSAESF